MNPISSFWLSKRQAKALDMITGGSLLDIGSRRERIRSDAISLDVDRKVRPDVCASAECLPFKSDAFDYISMLEVVEHLDSEQLDRALKESKRVGNFLFFRLRTVTRGFGIESYGLCGATQLVENGSELTNNFLEKIRWQSC